ncbi:MAG: hypothetical protein HYV42_05205 [Candidatus Magasanikbacteria bacterium]|nr:hypothetical protein [Candidatus Magasanikbacteria bacterium]
MIRNPETTGPPPETLSPPETMELPPRLKEIIATINTFTDTYLSGENQDRDPKEVDAPGEELDRVKTVAEEFETQWINPDPRLALEASRQLHHPKARLEFLEMATRRLALHAGDAIAFPLYTRYAGEAGIREDKIKEEVERMHNSLAWKRGDEALAKIQKLLDSDLLAAIQLYLSARELPRVNWYGVEDKIAKMVDKRLQEKLAEGLEPTIAFYRQLPDETPGVDSAANELYELARKSCQTSTEILPCIKERLGNLPDVLASVATGYYRDSQEWTPAVRYEIFSQLQTQGTKPSMLQRFSLRDFPPEHRTAAAPAIFAARQKYNPATIIRDFDEFEPLFLALPEAEQAKIIDAAIPIYYNYLTRFYPIIPLTPEQRLKWLTEVADHETSSLPIIPVEFTRPERDSIIDILVGRHVFHLLDEGVLAKLQLSPEEISAVKLRLCRENPWERLKYSAFPLSLEERREIIHTIIQRLPTLNLELLHDGFYQKKITELTMAYPAETQANLRQAFVELPPSFFCPTEFLKYPAILQALLPPETLNSLAENFSWQPIYGKLLKSHPRAAREKYDPWKTDLDPLVEQALTRGVLRRDSAEDAELLKDFVHTYGMYNLPTLLRWHVAISRSEKITDLPAEVRQELTSTLGIRLEELPNKGFIINEIKKFGRRLQTALLADQVPPELNTDLGLEFFHAIKGATSWEQKNDDPRKNIQLWQTTVAANPDQAALPAGYQEVTFKLPSVASSREQIPQAQAAREQEILTNPDLRGWVKKLDVAYRTARNIDQLPHWWAEEHQRLVLEIDQQIARLDELATAWETEKPVNRKALTRQRQTLVETRATLERLEAPTLSPDRGARDRELISWLEAILMLLPKKVIDRDRLLQIISAYHSLLVMPDGRQSVIERALEENTEVSSATQVELWYNHLGEYLNEHYLNNKQEEHRTGHQPFSSTLLKELQLVWGIKPKLQKHPLVIAAEQLSALQQTETPLVKAGGKTVEVTLVPVRGILRIYAGDIGDACFTSHHRAFARGEYRTITPLIFVTGRHTPQERLRGSVLAIETKTPQGELVLLVRANNPQEGLLSQVVPDTLIAQTLAALRQIAAQRNIPHTVVPLDQTSRSSTNRPEVARYYEQHFKEQPKVTLIKEPVTNFNGYANWNPEGEHPVVEI